MNTILVADDDSHIRRLIRLYLEKNQFSVVEAADGQEALDILAHTKIDLVIVDVMMPNVDGIELTEDIRSYIDIPILMVTARGESKDKVRGFNAGSDDYLVKPFDPIELVLRVKSLLKRYHLTSSSVIQLGAVMIDLGNLNVVTAQRTVELKKKECELLFALAGSPGQIFTRSQLIENIWGVDYEGDERTVDVHIKRLRERLESIPELIISTVRGLGYRLELA
ncbi:DNA-binding response regulator [Paenibacillus odorifer]|jgi:two-component system OmpR family response regulator|uniref:Heme response regulator HssR n=1 Tax=Paenibacillus odorifer TaxID=189426 RepID=A0ABX3GLH3_9BACL|nr:MULTISPECIES: response regulator transcription factor [Paenibacillus]MDH6430413.1 two-component system OmpR family response regulator [Paenibacillus sp. PastH-4]MDH6447006.1 two-component system OmpR family response regulator [Paenibacillus sp. PastF-4]MDH6530805.1 two-component system OmpR family response regulator [Paenibacillus sp. PastH-3]OMC74117.1 DNA-binding response regulator [Paenibacillus odorifer]OMD31616.1 DNA-binding response regulator [Paenibacillus odorifer]